MKKKNRMGVMSGVTQKFSISTKKRLTDPHIIYFEGIRTSKSIESWIKEDPQMVYAEVYEKGRLQLCSDAIGRLKESLRLNYPMLLQAIEDKKASHWNRSRGG